MFENITISNDVKIGDIHDFFEQNIPSHKPEYYWDARLSSKSVFIARDNGTVCGFLVFNIIWGDMAFIELIKIKDDYQRAGIGKKLLLEAANHISKLRFTKLISSSEVINDDGKAFHTRMGFEKLNTLDLPHGEEQFYKIEIKDLLKHA